MILVVKETRTAELLNGAMVQRGGQSQGPGAHPRHAEGTRRGWRAETSAWALSLLANGQCPL